MIKQAVITLAFGATLIEKHPQPDILHKNYSPLPQLNNLVYGHIQVDQIANSRAEYSSIAILATELTQS